MLENGFGRSKVQEMKGQNGTYLQAVPQTPDPKSSLFPQDAVLQFSSPGRHHFLHIEGLQGHSEEICCLENWVLCAEVKHFPGQRLWLNLSRGNFLSAG